MSWSRRLAIAAAAMTLAACGFRPMHASYKDGSVPADLASVYVAQIPDRVGQQVRNHLLDLLNPGGEPAKEKYRLSVRLDRSVSRAAIRSTELETRRHVRLAASYRLTTADGETELYRSAYTAITSYNVVSSEYAVLAAEQNADALAARQVADAIQTQIALYFTSRR